MKSDIQNQREAYIPKIPLELNDFIYLSPSSSHVIAVDSEIASFFSPHLSEPTVITFNKTSQSLCSPLNIGIVFSGGPAAGGHNVAVAVFDSLQQIHKESRLIGFIGGSSGIIDNNWCLLDQKKIDNVRNMGGFDLLGTGRTKIENEDQFIRCKEACEKNQLDGLIIVGGDDSNTNAAFLAKYFLASGCKTSVVGVPKTIDGDLKNKWIETSFGFDSASKTYSEIIGNIASDAKSQNKYYFFIKVMGRTASHLLLECALQTQPNMALISEEISQKNMTLAMIVQDVCTLICDRAKIGQNSGIILIPEGLIEFIPEFKAMLVELNNNKELSHLSHASLALFQRLPKNLQTQLLLDRDPHGNIPVSKIETERLFINLVEHELALRGDPSIKFSAQPLFVGYEGRCCLPSNFDCDYCYTLGKVATLLVAHKKTGMMAIVKRLNQPASQWECQGIPLIAMMKFVNRNGKNKAVIEQTLVDLDGPAFQEFEGKKEAWRTTDFYLNPGPIQFFGPSFITDRITKTLQHEMQ